MEREAAVGLVGGCPETQVGTLVARDAALGVEGVHGAVDVLGFDADRAGGIKVVHVMHAVDDAVQGVGGITAAELGAQQGVAGVVEADLDGVVDAVGAGLPGSIGSPGHGDAALGVVVLLAAVREALLRQGGAIYVVAVHLAAGQGSRGQGVVGAEALHHPGRPGQGVRAVGSARATVDEHTRRVVGAQFQLGILGIPR